MNIVQRVQDILLRPQTTWPVIDRESATTASLYTSYLMVLAAIPAIAGFIGLSIVGVGGFGVTFRVPFFAGLVNMVVGYVLSLVAVFVLSLVVDALAPTFGGRKDPISALKLVVFGATAALVGGIFSVIPAMGLLGLLAALYTVYLIYLGLPVLMKCPADKALAYTAVVVVCGIVLGVVIGSLAALTLPSRGLGGMPTAGSGGDVTISVPGTDIKVDSGAMEAMARKMEEAGKKMEAAQQSGDTAAAGQAMGEILASVGGVGGAALPVAELKALLPETWAGLARESIETTGGQVAGIAGATAKAAYAGGDKRLNLAVTDMGGIGAIAAAGIVGIESERETADRIERTYKQGRRTVKEEAMKDGSRSELTVMLANGVVVQAEADGMDLATLKGMVEGLGLDALEAKQRPTRQ